eukprot:comp18132_c0_seq1/m.18848 comp18132_c0_seq1/g.18848  ORF comp18132_c0_seq1/g.18848 comp18132_c0_seq1/m.18848 type:complete len:513 (-) comp18132_c0_seq1:33-1571(-)
MTMDVIVNTLEAARKPLQSLCRLVEASRQTGFWAFLAACFAPQLDYEKAMALLLEAKKQTDVAEDKARQLGRALESAREDLAKRERVMALTVAAWQKERDLQERAAAFVQDHNAKACDIITLNVGGQPITTTRSTLCRLPDSMLAAMFSGRHRLATDKEGRYFIDRDPKYFAHVLNYLRSDCTRPPKITCKDEDERERVLEEFQYFCISTEDASMAARIMTSPSAVTSEELAGHTAEVYCLAATETFIVSGSVDMTLRVWSAATGQCLRVLTGHEDAINSVAVCHDTIASGSYDCTTRRWDLGTGRVLSVWGGVEEGSEPVWAVACSPAHVASLSQGGKLSVYELGTGTRTMVLENVNTTYHICFQGRHLAIPVQDTLKLYDPSTGQCLRSVSPLLGSNLVAVAAWGSLLCTRDVNNRFIVWDSVQTKELPVHNANMEGGCIGFGFGPGTLMYGRREVLVVVDSGSGSSVELRGHTNGITDIVVRDGLVATAAKDGKVRVWRPGQVGEYRGL